MITSVTDRQRKRRPLTTVWSDNEIHAKNQVASTTALHLAINCHIPQKLTANTVPGLENIMIFLKK